MPKGDREKFKADTEDGYTKIADLLLEALAMAKLNGVQKGICLFLWRRTYGWGKTDDAISLREFSEACGTSESYISRQIKHLVSLGVVIRVSHESGKTPVYRFNTRVAEWNNDVISPDQLNDCVQKGLYNHSGVSQTCKGLTDVQGFNKTTSQPFNDCARVPFNKCARVPFNKCARVNQDSGQENQESTPPLYTDYRHNIDNNDDHDNARGQVAKVGRTYEQEFGRLPSGGEIETLKSYLEKEMAPEVICEAIKRARVQGSPWISYVSGILRRWLDAGVVDMPGVERVDAEFSKRKNRGSVDIRGPTGKQNNKPGGENKSEPAQEFQLDRSKFEFPG